MEGDIVPSRLRSKISMTKSEEIEQDRDKGRKVDDIDD